MLISLSKSRRLKASLHRRVTSTRSGVVDSSIARQVSCLPVTAALHSIASVSTALSRTELAIAELGEIVARGLAPCELAEKGWASLAGLMQQRRDLIAKESPTTQRGPRGRAALRFES